MTEDNRLEDNLATVTSLRDLSYLCYLWDEWKDSQPDWTKWRGGVVWNASEEARYDRDMSAWRERGRRIARAFDDLHAQECGRRYFHSDALLDEIDEIDESMIDLIDKLSEGPRAPFAVDWRREGF